MKYVYFVISLLYTQFMGWYFSFSNEDAMIISNNTISSSLLNGTDGKIETPNVKKRHRRMKSSGIKNTECDGKSLFLPLFYTLSIKD
jgi:hypothetical protein